MAAVCSCSSDDEPELTRGDFCRDWAEAACSEDTISACQASDAEACRTTQEAYCLDLVPTSFDPAQADDCISDVRAAYRDAELTAEELRIVQRLDAPCDRLIRGPGGEGASCDTTADCAAPDGFVCVRKGGSETGTCQKPEQVAAGDSCEEAQRVCPERTYCNEANCVAFRGIGMTCEYDEACGPQARCEAGECAARLPRGSDCEIDADCASNLCFTFEEEPRTCVDLLVLGRAEPFCAALR